MSDDVAINEKIKQIADHYGKKSQLLQTMEECGELTAACNKHLRNGTVDGLIEEIADVEIMTAQIKYLMNIGMYVNKAKENKVMRQLERMERE